MAGWQKLTGHWQAPAGHWHEEPQLQVWSEPVGKEEPTVSSPFFMQSYMIVVVIARTCRYYVCFML